jgi:hypothetical protein
LRASGNSEEKHHHQEKHLALHSPSPRNEFVETSQSPELTPLLSLETQFGVPHART